MKPEEIKKDLDSYKKDIGCAKCGFEDKYLLTILENALDLINRYEEIVKKCETVEHFADKTIATLQAENERLKDDNKFLQDRRFKELSEVKAEAIKEFADKVKSHSRKMQSSDFSGEFWDKAVLVADIDNLLKELVGEDNESKA